MLSKLSLSEMVTEFGFPNESLSFNPSNGQVQWTAFKKRLAFISLDYLVGMTVAKIVKCLLRKASEWMMSSLGLPAFRWRFKTSSKV